MQQNIVITGFMASGKSKISKELSKQLELFLLDTDEMIEKSVGEKIGLIFKNQGEKYFRKLEKKLFKSIKKSSGFVISTGGGFCLKKVQKLGLVVWIDTPFKQILKRLNDDELANRPKAQTNTKDLKKLYKKRKKLYKKSAHITIKTKDLKIDEIIEKIILAIKKHSSDK